MINDYVNGFTLLLIFLNILFYKLIRLNKEKKNETTESSLKSNSKTLLMFPKKK